MRVPFFRKGQRITFHPLVFATFPILSLFVRNLDKGYQREAIIFTAAALVLCLLLWLLVRLLVRDGERSAIIVSVFFLLLFFYGHARSAVDALLGRLNLQDSAAVLLYGATAEAGWLVLWLLLFAVGCYAAVRLFRKVDLVTQALNLMSLTLLVVLGANAVAASEIPDALSSRIGQLVTPEEYPQASPANDTQPGSFRVFLPIVVRTTEQLSFSETADKYADRYRDLWLDDIQEGNQTPRSLPDIYYIILDKYVRSDYLEEVFTFDNSEFISALESRGFYVPRSSRANYPYTIVSLPSSLNFIHLDELVARRPELAGLNRSAIHGILAAMIRENRVSSFLHDRGYTTMAFYTGFRFTEIKNADVYLEPPFAGITVSEFQLGLLELTPLSAIPAIKNIRDNATRQRVLFPLEHIPDAAVDDLPTFAFAHILSPHGPYVFGPKGEPIPSRRHYTYEKYLEAYRNQVAHINNRTLQLIDEILAVSPDPPIIIIQSDHGTCYGADYEFDPCMGERMSILNAYYFPDDDYADLYDDITPVNTFRVVFNRYFGTDYPLLDDNSYYSRPSSLFDFKDVTNQATGND